MINTTQDDIDMTATHGLIGAAEKQASARWCAEIRAHVQAEQKRLAPERLAQAKALVGKFVRITDDDDTRFNRGEVLQAGNIPGRILVKWPHETAWANVQDCELV